MTDDHAELRSCALYLTGGLDPEAEREFERHLGGCLICLDECDRLSPAADAMAALSHDEVQALLAENPFPPAAVPFGAGATASGRSVRAGRTDSTGPAGRGSGGRPAGGPGGSGRSRWRRRLALGSLAVVAVVSIGFALSQSFTVDSPPGGQVTVDPRAVAVTAEGVGGRAHLSVSVAALTGRAAPACAVTATVIGLEEGVQYRLYAVTADTETHQVAQFAGAPGASEVTGEIAAGLDELAFFAVARLDGGTVVSARIARPPSPTR